MTEANKEKANTARFIAEWQAELNKSNTKLSSLGSISGEVLGVSRRDGSRALSEKMRLLLVQHRSEIGGIFERNFSAEQAKEVLELGASILNREGLKVEITALGSLVAACGKEKQNLAWIAFVVGKIWNSEKYSEEEKQIGTFFATKISDDAMISAFDRKLRRTKGAHESSRQSQMEREITQILRKAEID